MDPIEEIIAKGRFGLSRKYCVGFVKEIFVVNIIIIIIIIIIILYFILVYTVKHSQIFFTRT
jgi:hypothetical protein